MLFCRVKEKFPLWFLFFDLNLDFKKSNDKTTIIAFLKINYEKVVVPYKFLLFSKYNDKS